MEIKNNNSRLCEIEDSGNLSSKESNHIESDRDDKDSSLYSKRKKRTRKPSKEKILETSPNKRYSRVSLQH